MEGLKTLFFGLNSCNLDKFIYTIKTDSGKSTKLTATYSPFYWGNFLGFIGFAFDGITGAMWSLPSKLNIDKGENQDDWIDRL